MTKVRAADLANTYKDIVSLCKAHKTRDQARLLAHLHKKKRDILCHCLFWSRLLNTTKNLSPKDQKSLRVEQEALRFLGDWSQYTREKKKRTRTQRDRVLLGRGRALRVVLRTLQGGLQQSLNS